MNFIWHLKQRCKIIPESSVIDFDNELFSCYLYNLSGQVIGYQRYNWRASKKKKNNITGRYYTYITKQDRCSSTVVMGLERISYGEPLYLVEGMFEMLTAQSYGINCVAVLTNNPKHLKNWMYTYPNTTIALCQDDSAGHKLKNITDSYIILPKDIDEMTKDEVQYLMK